MISLHFWCFFLIAKEKGSRKRGRVSLWFHFIAWCYGCDMGDELLVYLLCFFFFFLFLKKRKVCEEMIGSWCDG
jgi:hypothetical protein